MTEKIPQPDFNETSEKEHLAPFEREEGRRIEDVSESISAQRELEKIIQLSSDQLPMETEKRHQDVILAAKDYLERLSASDSKEAERLADLIEKAEKEIHKKVMAKVGPITKIHDPRKQRKKFR